MSTINFDINLAVQGFQQNLNKVNTQLGDFHKDFQKNTSKSSTAFSSFLGNLGANLVTNAISGLTSLAGSMGQLGIDAVKNAGQLEQMSVELGVMLGSAAAGEAQLKSLQQFAATSPFQLPGIVEANKLLLSFGVTVAEVPKTLEFLGNIAAGSGKPLSELARIFGQVAAQTKLSTEKLNQLNDAGVNLGPTLATKLGIPLKDVRKAVTDGKVSFELFRESLEQIQAKGGIYADGMIKQSKTLEGTLSTLKDNFFNLSGSIGQALLPVIKLAVDGLTSLTVIISNNIDNIKIAAVTLGIMATAYGAYLIATNAATIATVAFNLALKVTPWGLALTAISLVGAGIFSLIKYWDDVKLAALNAVKSILETLIPLENLLAKFFGFDAGVLASSLDSINNKILTIKDTIAKKNEPIVDPAELKRVEEAAALAAEAKRKAAADELAIKMATNAAIQENQRIHNENMLLADQEGVLSLQEFRTENDEMELEARNARQTAELEERQAFDFAKIEAAYATEMAIANAKTDANEKRKAIEDAENKAALARITLHNKQIVDSEKLKANQLKSNKAQELKEQASFYDATAVLATSNNKALGAIGKASALAQLAMKAPEAIANSFAFGTRTGGPVLGAVFGGIAAAAMAAQASRITNVGNFATGGFISGNSYSGDRLTANVNSGEAVLNVSQQKEFMRMANGSTGSAGDVLVNAINNLGDRIANMEIKLIANDTEIAKSASRGVMNGVEIGRSR